MKLHDIQEVEENFQEELQEKFIVQLWLILENDVINCILSWISLQYRMSTLSEARTIMEETMTSVTKFRLK